MPLCLSAIATDGETAAEALAAVVTRARAELGDRAVRKLLHRALADLDD